MRETEMMTIEYLMSWSKSELVKYARKAQKGLPQAEVFTTGTKADIAYSIHAALKNSSKR